MKSFSLIEVVLSLFIVSLLTATVYAYIGQARRTVQVSAFHAECIAYTQKNYKDIISSATNSFAKKVFTNSNKMDINAEIIDSHIKLTFKKNVQGRPYLREQFLKAPYNKNED